MRRRVFIVEDHPIFLEGLTRCLDAEPDFRVVAQSSHGNIDLDELRRLAPDLVLVDVELPDANGIEVTRRIRRALPELPVVILTAFSDPDLLLEATRAGAAGYLLKHMRPAELVMTLRRIATGEHVVTPNSPPACCGSSRRGRTAVRRRGSCSSRRAVTRQVVLLVGALPDIVVVADKHKLKQALGNLLDNAIDATPAGERVEVDAAVDDGHVRVRVRDRGPGVAAAVRDRLFTPFCTTKPDGIGLGLVLAKELVEAHGGTVDWRPEAPGTVFVLSVPPGSAPA